MSAINRDMEFVLIILGVFYLIFGITVGVQSAVWNNDLRDASWAELIWYGMKVAVMWGPRILWYGANQLFSKIRRR